MKPKNLRIEIISGPDGLGRSLFTATWDADYFLGDPNGEHRKGRKAQVFFTNVKEFKKRWIKHRQEES